MGLCKFSSKKTKKRIFSDLGFNIHGELVENIYDLLFERATTALFSELSTAGFSIYDFFGDRVIEIKKSYLKYFEISDNYFKLTKSTWLNKDFVRKDLAELKIQFPEAFIDMDTNILGIGSCD